MRNTKATLLCLFLVLIVSLCGCSSAAPGGMEVSEGEPMEITAFTFAHRGVSAEDCYTYTAEASEGGTRLLLSFISGNYTDEFMVEEPILQKLGEIAGKYRLDLWNGFDKTKSNVSDGSGFTLSITLADGSEIYAHGSNAFPDRYQEAKGEITAAFDELISAYSSVYAELYA